MSWCPECETQVVLRDESGPGICPHCGVGLVSSPDSDWISVARLMSLAEAGYFADILADHGVQAQTRLAHDFSAVDGRWESVYVLQVREAEAELAAARIQAALGKEDDLAHPEHDADEDSPALPVIWRPLALMVMAVAVAYLAGRGVWNLRGAEPARAPSDRLWDTMMQIDRPFVSPPGRDGVRYRFRIDRTANAVILEQDRDADGLYESVRRFRQNAETRRNR